MGNTRKDQSPSKPRSKSKGRPRSKSTSGKSPKKTPVKRSPSKSPSRKATPKKQAKVVNNKKVVSKTPTPAPRSRSTSRARKTNTAPAAPKQQQSESRSRSRSRTTTNRKPQLATATVSSGQQQSQRPSSSLNQYLRPRNQSSIQGAANKGQGVVKAVWNGATQKLRKVLNGSYLNTKYWSKTKRHFKIHWKHWLTALMVVLISYFAYKFSKELIASVKQLSQTISEYAEEKRKIFGQYSEQARKYSYDTYETYYENARKSFENAKKAYFAQEPPEIKPFDHVEKPKEVPSQQTTPPIAPHHNPRGVDNRV